VAFAVSLGELLRLLLAFLQVPGPDRPAPAAQPLHGPEEIFFRMVRFEEFDVAELSLSTYVLTAQRDAPFVAIPVFPPAPSGTAGSTSTRGPALARRRTWLGRQVGVAAETRDALTI
jgi:hypothetical protein